MDHFEQDKLELKESIVPGVREETEKRDKTIHDEILPSSSGVENGISLSMGLLGRYEKVLM